MKQVSKFWNISLHFSHSPPQNYEDQIAKKLLIFSKTLSKKLQFLYAMVFKKGDSSGLGNLKLESDPGVAFCLVYKSEHGYNK